MQIGQRVTPGLQVGEAHTFERFANARVDALPGRADAAVGLEIAKAVRRAAFGDRDGSLERVEDLGGADRRGGTGKGVTALDAAARYDEARMNQRLQQLADGRRT